MRPSIDPNYHGRAGGGPPAASGGLEVRPVERAADLGAFIRVPERINRHDPAWIPPLRLERRLHLASRNPYFRHAEWQAWIALRGGRPAGRISAQVDRLHRERHGADTGHFGFLDGEDDPGVFAALLAAAEAWLAARGTRRVTGPFNLSINHDCGLLVEGFDTSPAVMMPHNPPWYGERLEEQGYNAAVDLLAFWIRTDFRHPRVMEAARRRYGRRLTVRPLERRRLAAELAILRDLFNDAWEENWGFVPFTAEEFEDLGHTLKLLVPDDLIQIAELDGEPAAFIVAMPDLNHAIRDLDGRLMPAGWARLLWRLKVGGLRRGRVPLMGVRRRHQGGPLGAALALEVIAAVQQALWNRGITGVELSWILEGNTGMRTILESIGSTVYKRYRLYRKVLPGATTAGTGAAAG